MQSCYYPHFFEHITTGTAKVQPSCSQNRNQDENTSNAVLCSTDVFAKSLFRFIYLLQAGEARKEIHNPTVPRFVSAVDALNEVTEYSLIHCKMISSS